MLNSAAATNEKLNKAEGRHKIRNVPRECLKESGWPSLGPSFARNGFLSMKLFDFAASRHKSILRHRQNVWMCGMSRSSERRDGQSIRLPVIWHFSFKLKGDAPPPFCCIFFFLPSDWSDAAAAVLVEQTLATFWSCCHGNTINLKGCSPWMSNYAKKLRDSLQSGFLLQLFQDDVYYKIHISCIAHRPSSWGSQALIYSSIYLKHMPQGAGVIHESPIGPWEPRKEREKCCEHRRP